MQFATFGIGLVYSRDSVNVQRGLNAYKTVKSRYFDFYLYSFPEILWSDDEFCVEINWYLLGLAKWSLMGRVTMLKAFQFKYILLYKVWVRYFYESGIK